MDTQQIIAQADLEEDFPLSANPSESGLDDLDMLIVESMKEQKAHDAVITARRALKNSSLSKADTEALQARVTEWEMKREWDAVAAVVIFETQSCANCNSEHSHYVGLFQRQLSRTNRNTRWVKATNMMNIGLPKEIKYQIAVSDLCIECVSTFGWEK